MPLVLQIDSGPRQGEQIVLQLGVPLRVGRTSRADVAIPEDTFLSGVHFLLESQEQGCVLRDLNSSNGTTLRGSRVGSQFLFPGDVFTAGQTEFRLLGVELEQAEGAQNKPESPDEGEVMPLSTASRSRMLDVLRTQQQPLYAVLDAARDPRILALFQEHRCQYAWLFEQGTPPQLMTFAPYLLPLPSGSTILESLLEAGWTQHWGIYLCSNAGPWEVLAFLRRLLLVDQPDGQQALFRFYDPRVLRTFIAASEPWQWPFLFGTVRSYLMPGTEPQTSVSFTFQGNALGQSVLRLEQQAAPASKPVQGSGAPPPKSGNRLCLTTAQMTALKAGERDPFEDEVLHEMKERFPARFVGENTAEMRRWIRYGCERAKRYGIRENKNLRLYIALMMQLGRDFDADAGLPWAGDMLRRRLQPQDKLTRLTKLAQEHAA